MTEYFRRQLANYADAHRDQANSVMHTIGNPILFVAGVRPLCLLPATVFGVQMSAAPLLSIPALMLWTAWDLGIGLAIVVSSIPLLLVAGAVAGHFSTLWVWLIAAGLFAFGWALQIIGHWLFEGNRPALLENPVQMLISPTYIFAKLFIATGLRPDLAAVLQKSRQRSPLVPPPSPLGSEAGADKTR
jgi:uncharacterized membrane protein YGL010W